MQGYHVVNNLGYDLNFNLKIITLQKETYWDNAFREGNTHSWKTENENKNRNPNN